MVFNSYEFIFEFLPAACIVWFVLFGKKRGAGVWWLGIASLFFYYVRRPNAVWLLPCSILLNYGVSLLLVRRKSRFWLTLGILANVLALSLFKYEAAVVNAVATSGGSPSAWFRLGYPLGISFFTFSQISYLVDVYRGEDRPAGFGDYLLFVTFFPHLLAGPILRHREMIPQFDSIFRRRPIPRNLARGIALIVMGLVKKVLIADPLAPFAAKAFDVPGSLDAGTAWLGVLAYTFQLYNDFSGYCDIALGAALLFNIRIPENFRAPYQATSIQEFWRCWHISLSNWLRDYIYLSLPGVRSRRRIVQYGNGVLTMLVCGIWHGFGWTFILWGLAHGIAVVICAVWRRLGWWRMPAVAGWALTFGFVSMAWVLFRSPDLATSGRVFAAMFSGIPIHAWRPDMDGGNLALLIALLLLPTPWYSFVLARLMKPTPWMAVLGAVLLTCAVMRFTSASHFLYYFF